MGRSDSAGPAHLGGAARARVERYIGIGVAEGAEVVLGGGGPVGLRSGWCVEPTIFTRVDNGMTIARGEVFGPVVTVIAFDGDNEVIAVANDSVHGLAGAVFIADLDRGLFGGAPHPGRPGDRERLSPRPGDAVGGFKQSGIGREGGPEGLAEYLELKTLNLPAGYVAGDP